MLLVHFLLVALPLVAAEPVPVSEPASAAESGDPPAAPEKTPFAEGAEDLSGSASAADEQQQQPMSFGLALRAARPWSFTATVAPVLLGSAVAFQAEGAFDPLLLFLSLGTTLSVHAAGNLMNTLFDFLNGYDSATSSDLTLVTGALKPRQMFQLIGAAFGAAALFAAPIPALSKAPLKQILLMLGAGAASSYVYTGGPGLKYRALGDVLITSTFGPLLVCFSFLVQTGLLGWRPFAASMPMMLHIEGILHANNARDIDEDRANGIFTLASLMGKRLSSTLYSALLLLPYGGVLLHTWSRSLLAAIPLVSAPQALRLSRDFRRGALRRMPMRTAKFQFLFGMLMVAGVLLPAPPLSSFFGTFAS